MRDKFWFEVEGGCFDCLLKCWIEVPGDDPKCPLIRSSEEKESMI